MYRIKRYIKNKLKNSVNEMICDVGGNIMKLTDLLAEQRLIVQLQWGEQQIEFDSEVIGSEESGIYVSPYLHAGKALSLDVCGGKDVICNLFTDDMSNQQRVSWKNVQLATVDRDGETVYFLSTHVFNSESEHDDRRDNDRTIVQVKAKLYDGRTDDGIDIIVHDISNSGISFFAPSSFIPRSQQLVIAFSDSIEDKQFDIKVDCTISRIISKAGNSFVGCRVNSASKDFMLYGFEKRFMLKNRDKMGDGSERKAS